MMDGPIRSGIVGLRPQSSDAIATLNRLGILVDEYGCFGQGEHRICLRIQGGIPFATVDGVEVRWRDLAARLEPRRPKRSKPR